jgi:hypothetical protein
MRRERQTVTFAGALLSNLPGGAEGWHGRQEQNIIPTMVTPTRSPGPVGRSSSPAPKALWRFARAICLTALVLVGCVLAVRALTPKVRDLTADELRQKMGDAAKVGAEARAGGGDAFAATEGALSVGTVIAQVNRMDVRERRELMRSDTAREYINNLPPESRRRFVRETLDRGLQDQLERYHKMSKDERARFIEDAKKRQQEAREKMDQMSQEEKDRVRDFANSGDIQEMVDKATKSFLSLTTSDERAELQPLFEGALDNLQHAQGLR